MGASLVYLASPYTHPDKSVEKDRFEQMVGVWVNLANNHPDLYFFSPILHSHSIAVHGGAPGNWEFWAGFDRLLISKCQEMWVVCLDGVEKSVGVSAEKQIAQDMGLPIRYVNPTTYEVSLNQP